MKYNITIGITTFKKRLDLFKDLLSQIKTFWPDIPVVVTINGENEEDFDEEYRREILEFISKMPNTYPIMSSGFRSLAKMWNNIVIFSETDYNFIINDDIAIHDPNLMSNIMNIINERGHEFFTLGSHSNGFSHFIITKKQLDDLGYFDERLLSFGEEDGDMVWRYIKKYNAEIPFYYIPGICHIAAHSDLPSNLVVHGGNKPRWNRTFLFKHKYEVDYYSDNVIGMFGIPHKKLLDDEKQYPYEMFRIKNKNNLKDGDEIDF